MQFLSIISMPAMSKAFIEILKAIIKISPAQNTTHEVKRFNEKAFSRSLKKSNASGSVTPANLN